MKTRLLTAPTVEPVTLTQAKLHCRVDSTDEDLLFNEIIIPGARDECESFLKRSVMLKTWLATLDAFPDDAIALPWPNLLEVDSVTYRDPVGTWVTLDPSVYTVGLASSRVTLAAGQSWPAISSEPESVKVTYKAGYATGDATAQRAAVPPAIKHWMLLRIGTAYLHRDELIVGTIVSQLPGRFVDGLLDAEKVWEF